MKIRKIKCQRHGCVLAPMHGSNASDKQSKSTSRVRKKKRGKKRSKKTPKGNGTMKKSSSSKKSVKKCKRKKYKASLLKWQSSKTKMSPTPSVFKFLIPLYKSKCKFAGIYPHLSQRN